MKLLGIDYGRKKIGLAVCDEQTRLATPLRVVRFEDMHKAFGEIKRAVEEENIDKLVIGISSGKIAEEAKNFGRLVGKSCFKEVEFVDETLTSKEAQSMSIAAGIQRKKRKSMEDAYSAALILESYLNSNI